MTVLNADSGAAASAYRLFGRVHRDGSTNFFAKKQLTIQGHRFHAWTSSRDAKTGVGHRVLNVSGKGWKFSFTAYAAEKYNIEAIQAVYRDAIICLESAHPVLVYDFIVNDEEAMKKELTIMRMFDEIDDSPLKRKIAWKNGG